jgi:hypothetical protein
MCSAAHYWQLHDGACQLSTGLLSNNLLQPVCPPELQLPPPSARRLASNAANPHAWQCDQEASAIRTDPLLCLMCRVCMVEVDGRIRPSCCTPAREGAVINTDTPEVRPGQQQQRQQ